MNPESRLEKLDEQETVVTAVCGAKRGQALPALASLISLDLPLVLFWQILGLSKTGHCIPCKYKQALDNLERDRKELVGWR
jgi:hypothetical protein